MKNTIKRESRTEINTENNKERVTAMKRVNIIVLTIGILIGAALCVFLLRDGRLSIPEAAAGFAYLAALRVGTVLARRGKKEAAAEKTPIRPLPSVSSISSQGPSAWKPAA